MITGIGSYGIQRNNKIATQQSPAAIVKRYNIGEIIVLQEFPVNLKYVLVIAKDIRKVTHRPVVRGCYLPNPLFQ